MIEIGAGKGASQVGGGGDDALNGPTNGAILAATPFGILLVPMCYGLYMTLKTDDREERSQVQKAPAHDRETELQQTKEIVAGGPPRRLRRVTPAPVDGTKTKPNGKG